jgi:hypothetical protein
METQIVNVNFHAMRNEVHVEFHETVNRLFDVYAPTDLGIEPQYKTHKSLLDDEAAALDAIRKSERTAEIVEQDHRRDCIFRGFVDSNKSALNHFDPDKVEAATKIIAVIEHYGNIAAKPLDQETAAIDDLLSELAAGDFPQQIQTLALADWIVQLDAENEQFKALMMLRYDEMAKRIVLNLKPLRDNVDIAFRDLAKQIEALVRVNGTATYEQPINAINAILTRYKNILAQEAGQRKAAKKKRTTIIDL